MHKNVLLNENIKPRGWHLALAVTVRIAYAVVYELACPIPKVGTGAYKTIIVYKLNVVFTVTHFEKMQLSDKDSAFSCAASSNKMVFSHIYWYSRSHASVANFKSRHLFSIFI